MSCDSSSFNFSLGDVGMVGLSPLDYLNYYLNGKIPQYILALATGRLTKIAAGTVSEASDAGFLFQ